MPASQPHFSPRLFTFLRALKRNNERAWFQANKERYIADVQQPMLSFIADFAEPLRKISANFIADPKPVGGSMFRVYRDTRFAHDKTPYKTHASAHFRHLAATKDVHAPGFYFHLEPGECFIGGGIWLPEVQVLKKVRDAIAYDVEGWRKVKRKTKNIEGDALTRPPQGYDPAHPFIDDLKRKSHFSHAAFSEAEVCSPRFLSRCAEACRAKAQLMQFLTEAVDLDW